MSMLVTPLGKWHQQNHGRMVEFAGWEMPVQYTSIVEEHLAVRAAAGLFDISHMGRLRLAGPFATEFLNRIVTIDVSCMRAGQVRYTLVCNHEGGILDDILVYRLDAHWELVVNASNRLKLLEWFEHTAGYAAGDGSDAWFIVADCHSSEGDDFHVFEGERHSEFAGGVSWCADLCA